jgi:hypothetical protein
LSINPAPAAPFSDTATVKSNPAQVEKSGSTPEKTTTLPSYQKKQPASLPESSVIAP